MNLLLSLHVCSLMLIMWPFSFLKAKKNPSNFILETKWGSKTSGAHFVYTFLNAELQNIPAQLLVRCCQKSQSQTEASALQNSYTLPSDLTRDCMHAIVMLFAPAIEQGGHWAIVVRCCGTAYLPIWGKYKLLLFLNPTAGVSFLIVNKLIVYHGIKGKRKVQNWISWNWYIFEL